MTTPDIDLAALTALEQAATPAPWVATENDRVLWMESPEDPLGLPVLETFHPNAEFIAALRNAMPALLSALTATRAELERTRAVVEAAQEAVADLLVVHPHIREAQSGWFHDSTLGLVRAVDALAAGAGDGEQDTATCCDQHVDDGCVPDEGCHTFDDYGKPCCDRCPSATTEASRA